MIHYDENGKHNLMGLPPVVFLAGSAIVLAAVYLERLPKNLFGGLALCAVIGYLIKYITDHVKVLEKTFGLALVAFLPAFLVYFHWIPDSAVEIVKSTVTGGADFLSFYVGALLCGSILGMDRKMLIRAGSRYFVPIIGGLLGAYGLGALVGMLMGQSWTDTILYVVGPIMGGGNGAGVVPMSEIYASHTGIGSDVFYARLYPRLAMGNWVSIFMAIVLNMAGSRYPKSTGYGKLMNDAEGAPVDDSYDYQMTIPDLGIGLFVTGACFIFGNLVSKFIPAIHAYAFTIIFVAVLKIAGVLPRKIEFCAVKWYHFMSNNFTVIIMAGVGLAMFDIASFFETLTPAFFVISAVVVIGGVIGAGLTGMLVKFFFVESAITAGLCMSNAGGNGDIQILSASNRMELMPFAQISSRLGGAIVLVIQSLLAALFLG